jgi:predicted nuclease of restriction endonuclease-like RecB superfamily
LEPLLPSKLLLRALPGASGEPRYLDESDRPWLRDLIDVYTAYAGRRRAELDERLSLGLRAGCPPGRLAQARHVMDRLCRDRTRAPLPPPRAREVLVQEAARGGNRDAVLRRAGARAGLDPERLLQSMLADLPGEKRVSAPPADLNPGGLALRVNAAIARSLLGRSVRVRMALSGNARDIVRHVHLRGLLCTVRRALPGEAVDAVLDISGPLALFRHTTLYGRALGSIVPRLPWCERFELRAQYRVDGQPRVVVLRSGDPIFPGEEPRRFDSKLEERFHADFSRAAPDWQLTREPEPLVAGDALIFPDFALFHRDRPARRFLLEIVGFWTAGYLEAKLRALRAARVDNLILCIDEQRNCASGRLPRNAVVIPYRRRIDPERVLRAVNR